MTKEEFDKCNNLDDLLNLNTSDRKWRLFAVACCRSIQHLMTDERSIKAVEAAELFADNLITKQQLDDARDAAWSVARYYAAMDAESDTAGSVAWAAWAAAWAAWSVARDAARDAASSAAWSVASSSAWDIERAKQVSFFKDIINPYVKPIDPTTLNWKDQTLVKIAEKAYNDKDFSVMPIMADALEEAGCQDVEILSHCRSKQQHLKGCWVVDLILGKG